MLASPAHAELCRIQRDRRTITYIGRAAHTEDYGVVQASTEIDMDADAFYYELTVLEDCSRGAAAAAAAGTDVSIGFAPRHYSGSSCAPLTCANSFAWRSSDGQLFEQWDEGETVGRMEGGAAAGGLRDFGPAWAEGDVVGAGVNLVSSTVFFTRNGDIVGSTPLELGRKSRVFLLLDPPGTNPDSTRRANRVDLHATVAMHARGGRVKLNFGSSEEPPFRFDLESYMAGQRKVADAQNSSASSAAPVAVPEAAVHRLVQEYLLQRGYVETFNAFNARLSDTHGADGEVTEGNGERPDRNPRRTRADLERLHATANERAQLHAWIVGRQAGLAASHLKASLGDKPVVAVALAAQSFIDALALGDDQEAVRVAREDLSPYLALPTQGNRDGKRRRRGAAVDTSPVTRDFGRLLLLDGGDGESWIGKGSAEEVQLPWLESGSAEMDKEQQTAVCRGALLHVLGLFAYDESIFDDRASESTNSSMAFLASLYHSLCVSKHVNDALLDSESPQCALDLVVRQTVATKEMERQKKGGGAPFVLPCMPRFEG